MLFILETWLDDTYSDQEVSIPGYVQYRKDRLGKEGRGILAHVREGIPIQRRTDLEYTNLEIMWLEINFPKMKPILLAGVYQPPDSVEAVDLKLVNNLTQAYFEDKEFYALGDFNVNMRDPSASKHRVIEGLESLALSQTITEITRPSSKTCIDHVWCASQDNIYQVAVPKIGISDHFPVCLVRKLKKGLLKPTTHLTIKYCCYKNFDETKFLDDLEQVPWHQIKAADSDPDSALANFESLFHDVLNEHAPVIEKRVKLCSQPPWMKPEILQAMKKRDKLLKEAMKSTTDNKKRSKEWKSYRKARNEVVWMINRSKREFYTESIVGSKGNSSEMWKSVNNILNRDKKSAAPRNIKVNGSDCSDPTEIAQAFCDFFANITTRYKSNLTPHQTDFRKVKQFTTVKVSGSLSSKSPTSCLSEV